MDFLISDVATTDCHLEKGKSGRKPDTIYKDKPQMGQTIEHRKSNKYEEKTWQIPLYKLHLHRRNQHHHRLFADLQPQNIRTPTPKVGCINDGMSMPPRTLAIKKD